MDSPSIDSQVLSFFKDLLELIFLSKAIGISTTINNTDRRIRELMSPNNLPNFIQYLTKVFAKPSKV